MAYLEAIKAALIAGKWLLLALFISSLVGFTYYSGVQHEREKWQFKTAKEQIEMDRALNNANDTVRQETAKSHAYADFIASEYNAKVDEIHHAHDQLDFNRVRERAACKSANNALPVRRSTGLPAEAADHDDTGFSDEFKQFLESERRRDQLNVAWIEAAVKEAQTLCQQPNVVCTGPK